MPALSNIKHEAFAQALAAGMSQVEAYEKAGYKPNDGHAARLAGNGRVVARVEELRSTALQEAQAELKYDAISIFRRIDDIIAEARAAGDHKVAMEGAKFIAKAFGYEDHPTLTHEHVKQTKIEITPNGVGEEGSASAPAAPTPANLNRFGTVMKKYRAK
jgi:hypothetical protein